MTRRSFIDHQVIVSLGIKGFQLLFYTGLKSLKIAVIVSVRIMLFLSETTIILPVQDLNLPASFSKSSENIEVRIPMINVVANP